MLLEAKNISVFYGAVKAIEDISFHVKKGEIVAMIGPNGAGKSTALKAVFGMVDIHSGDIYFDRFIEINKMGISILLVEQNARMAIEIAHRGYVFEIGKIFMEDTGKNLLESAEVKKTFLGG